MSRIINGKLLAKQFTDNLKNSISAIKSKNINFQPGLAIIQIGNREDSNIYIKNKLNQAFNVGINAKIYKFEKNTSELKILNQISDLNRDEKVHGIIVQLPFDSYENLNVNLILNSVHHSKDVDGLTNENAGKLTNGFLNDCIIPCTPKACLELIKNTGVSIKRKFAVVVGRSKLVGTPMASLLKWNDATVTICHRETENLKEICRMADILVVAIGCSNYIKGDWVQNGSIVIDCGINPIINKESNEKTITGDVDFIEASKIAGFITPVPGGVGPMTVSMLLLNTFESALKQISV